MEDPIVQWFLTFFATWIPKKSKTFPQTPKLQKCAIGGPRIPVKKVDKGTILYVCDFRGPLDYGPLGDPWTPG